MLIQRIVAVLVAIGIGASVFAFFFTRDRRYLAFAWRLARYAVIVALVFFGKRPAKSSSQPRLSR